MAITFSCNVQGGSSKPKLVALGKHNYRKFDESSETLSYINRELTHENIILIGTDNVLEDLQKVYKKEFAGAVAEYNSRQKRSDRKIFDYFEKVAQDKKTNLYSSVVLQHGDKEFWQGKSIEEKKKAIPMLQEQLKLFQASFPNFKIASAVIHLDETSPHVQLIGIGVQNYKTGLTKRVSQKGAFGDKKNLRLFQEVYKKQCLEIYNQMYHTNETLKEKTGRRFRYTQEEYIKFKENMNSALEKLDGQKIGNRIILKEEQVEEVKEILKTHSEILGTVAENKRLRKQLQEQEEHLQQLSDKKNKEIDELDLYLQQVEQSKKNAQEQLQAIQEQLEIDRELEQELQKKNQKLKEQNKKLEQKIEEQDKFISKQKVIMQRLGVKIDYELTAHDIEIMKQIYSDNVEKMKLQEKKIEEQNSRIEKQLEEKYTNVYNHVMKKELTILKKTDVQKLLDDIRNYKEFLNVIGSVANVQELFQKGKSLVMKNSRVNSSWASRTKTDKNRGRDW